MLVVPGKVYFWFAAFLKYKKMFIPECIERLQPGFASLSAALNAGRFMLSFLLILLQVD